MTRKGVTTLTDDEMLATLAAYAEGERTVGPTLAWLADRLDMSSKPGIVRRLLRLEQRGWLARTRAKYGEGAYSVTREGRLALAAMPDPQDAYCAPRDDDEFWANEEAKRDEGREGVPGMIEARYEPGEIEFLKAALMKGGWA